VSRAQAGLVQKLPPVAAQARSRRPSRVSLSWERNGGAAGLFPPQITELSSSDSGSAKSAPSAAWNAARPV
jgi:hypothetical protein